MAMQLPGCGGMTYSGIFADSHLISIFENLKGQSYRESPQRRVLLCRQDSKNFRAGKDRQVLFPQPSAEIRKEPADQHAGGILPGEEGIVRRSGNGRSGEGMETVSYPAS